jgi:hypothetical protein
MLLLRLVVVFLSETGGVTPTYLKVPSFILAVCCLLPAAYYLLLAIYFLLPPFCCLVSVASCLLFGGSDLT